MKLKTRIKLICFVMAAVIVLVSACLIIFNMRHSLRTNAELSAQAIGKQTILVLDNVIGVMDEISLAPILDPAIYQILRTDYSLSENRYELYQNQKVVTGQLYNNVYYRSETIYGITYISKDLDLVCYTNKSCFSPNLDGLDSQLWYRKLAESGEDCSVFSIQSDEMYPRSGALLCFARIIRDAFSGEEVGVIRVDVRLSDLAYIWENAKFSPETQLIVQDQRGQLLYATMEETLLPKTEMIGNTSLSVNGTKYISVFAGGEEYGYDLISLTPVSFAYRNMKNVMITICFVALVCIAAAFWLSEVLSDHIMKPIRDLNHCMKAVCGNDLTIRSEVKVGGEFGEVCQSFNLMVDNTEQLIARIYEEEEKKRKAEFQSLQAQISPHFLLNTLNTIRWMAVLQGNKAIAGTLEDLSQMLAFTIRDTRDKISIDTELRQIEHYLNILAVRYPNRFEVEFEIDPAVRKCLTLKFLLQPFLENSIFHGFDGLEREGKVGISIALSGDRVRYQITDNGNGIPPEQLETMLTRQTTQNRGMNRIGVSNVVERVSMVYGSTYFVKIESEVNRFTRVTIEIPAEYECEVVGTA